MDRRDIMQHIINAPDSMGIAANQDGDNHDDHSTSNNSIPRLIDRPLSHGLHDWSDAESDDPNDNNNDDDNSSKSFSSIPALESNNEWVGNGGAIHDHDDNDDVPPLLLVDRSAWHDDDSDDDDEDDVPPLLDRPAWHDDDDDSDGDDDDDEDILDLVNVARYVVLVEVEDPALVYQSIYDALRERELVDFREFCNGLRQNELVDVNLQPFVAAMIQDPREAEAFAAATQGNTSVKRLDVQCVFHLLGPGDPDEELDRRWRIIGQAIGNLQGLQTLKVEGHRPDVKALREIFEGAKQVEKVVFSMDLLDGYNWTILDALEGHPDLKEIEVCSAVDPGPMETLCEVLTTVPNLNCIRLLNCLDHPSRVLPHTFFALLGRGVREMALQRCAFSVEQCQMLASYLSNAEDECAIETLDFQYSRFEAGGLIAAALGRNQHVRKLVLSDDGLDEETCARLAESLLVNTTITSLHIETEDFDLAPEVIDDDGTPEDDDNGGFDTAWLKPIFAALKSNLTLETLSVGQLCDWDDETGDEFRALLESPTTGIQSLLLHSSYYDDVDERSKSWLRIAPALRVNRSLKSLRLLSDVGQAGAVQTARALSGNSTLQTLEVWTCDKESCCNEHNHNHEDDCVIAQSIEELGGNTTLQALCIDTCPTQHSKGISEEGCRRLSAALKTNMGIEDLGVALDRVAFFKPTIESIARLNAVGRKYLKAHAFDQAKGVQVLSKVNDSLDCIFLHLQENPSLCG
ncbi:NACHT domain [Seminavis robusta]|uniref:NACHT domain n=1 Tax=Seminavis robusta TaxID=568900 RepID=A0A9N8E308_9STRA|nr:NACHT domain [Seminavis robusta]|eukprot:Sro492_g153870.1 NACHT domain (745) ;mRNA; r:29733-31967